MRRILAVSTDKRLLDALEDSLSANGFIVNQLTNPAILFDEIVACRPDLLLVDFILQHENGGAICHQVKCNPLTRNLPVMLLSEYDGLDRFANEFGSCAIVKRTALFPALIDEIQHIFEEYAA